MKELTHKEMSRKGGLATKKRNGKRHFRIMGLKGAYGRGFLTKEEFDKRMKVLLG
jgi:hypothetical protein